MKVPGSPEGRRRRAALLVAWLVAGIGLATGARAEAAEGNVSGEVKTAARSASDVVDPMGAVATRFLVGLPPDPPAALKPASLTPSWLVSVRAEFAELWQREPKERDALHALASVRPAILTLVRDRPSAASARRWSTIGCRAASSTAKTEVVVLATHRDGISLVGLTLRCEGTGGGAAMRLIARILALGGVVDVAGLELPDAPPAPHAAAAVIWPIGPALLDAPGRPLLRSGHSWLAQLEVGVEAPEPAEAPLQALPGPQAATDAPSTSRPRALCLLLADDGVPRASLIDGSLEATAEERTAAAVRGAFERGIAKATTHRPAPLPRLGIWTIEREGGVAVAVVLLGRIADDGSLRDAGVAAWRIASGAAERLSVPLPRTTDAGRWRCDDEDAGAALRCQFEVDGMPGARHFEPHRLILGARGYRDAGSTR